MGINSEVVSPPHYTGEVECVDAIKSFLGADRFDAYCLGQVVKYIWRAGKKDSYYLDLQKAQFYLSMAIGKDPRENMLE